MYWSIDLPWHRPSICSTTSLLHATCYIPALSVADNIVVKMLMLMGLRRRRLEHLVKKKLKITLPPASPTVSIHVAPKAVIVHKIFWRVEGKTNWSHCSLSYNCSPTGESYTTWLNTALLLFTSTLHLHKFTVVQSSGWGGETGEENKEQKKQWIGRGDWGAGVDSQGN